MEGQELEEIGKEFGVGYTSIVGAWERGAQYLATTPALRARVEAEAK